MYINNQIIRNKYRVTTKFWWLMPAYLLRHCQSQYNVAEENSTLDQSRDDLFDAPLSENGVR